MFKSKVIINVGPASSDSLGIGVGLSDDGPMAGAVCWRVRGCGEIGVGFDGSKFSGGDGAAWR